MARGRGWPSTDTDVLGGMWRLRPLLPVGFYYKVFARPIWLWPRIEPLIRSITGLGHVDLGASPRLRETINHHPDVLVVGGGVAGLAAAQAAHDTGRSVALIDEGSIGEKLSSPRARAECDVLRAALLERDGVSIFEHATAIGVYEGPFVPVDAKDHLHLFWPSQVIVATGAVERHGVFPNNDLPGIWLGRGAARLAAVHHLRPGDHALVVGSTAETLGHADVLSSAGVEVQAIVTPEPQSLRRDTTNLATDRPLVEGNLVEAKGRKRLGAAVVRLADGTKRTFGCDSLVLSIGLVPRDALLRQATGPWLSGVGDVVDPGCDLDAAIQAGRTVGAGLQHPARVRPRQRLAADRLDGFVCVCEDVEARDLRDAWSEGFRSTELLKRYTTTCMGPCQGALCQPFLREFVASKMPGDGPQAAQTTSRPPSRPLRLEDAAAGRHRDLEERTALHDRHLALGARMERVGRWSRPESYGSTTDEYWAVRERVSIMDVGTLGKFLVRGPDALEFLEALYPCHVANLAEGRSRYALLLNEEGYVTDDGLIAALGHDSYYVTFTSAGADHAEAWMRDWIDTLGLNVYLVNETAARGAINVAGPAARELLGTISSDPIDADNFPYMGVRHINVAGIPCLALRVGFVGELSFELHSPSRRSVELWDTLLDAGKPYDLIPHGLEALRLLRLEKGHIIIGQDTDFDSAPRNLGLEFAIKLEEEMVPRP